MTNVELIGLEKKSAFCISSDKNENYLQFVN